MQEWETSLSWALIVRLRQDLSNCGKGMDTEVMVIPWAGLDLREGCGKFVNQLEWLGVMQKHFLNNIKKKHKIKLESLLSPFRPNFHPVQVYE